MSDFPTDVEPLDDAAVADGVEPVEVDDIDFALAPIATTSPVADDGPDATEPEPENAPVVAPADKPLLEVLPADFQLPLLTRFVPNVELRVSLAHAVERATNLEVRGEQGLHAADAAVADVREVLDQIAANFEDAARIANSVHKHITSTRSAWMEPGRDVVGLVGARIANERRRLDQAAAAERRRLQEIEDKKAREAREAEAAAAAKQGAPPVVVEQMREAAKVATAPPLPPPPPVKLAHSTPTFTPKARIAGTPPDDEPNPATKDMSQAQVAEVFKTLKAILDGQQSITLIEMNWSLLNDMAKRQSKAFAVPGFERFEEAGTRRKPRR